MAVVTATMSEPAAYCSHDGVPCAGEDVAVVVALIMALQLLCEVLSGQLNQETVKPEVSVTKDF